jgi:hypothetical protein
MPGRSWRGRAEAEAGRVTGEEAAGEEAETRPEERPGDFLEGCWTGEELLLFLPDEKSPKRCTVQKREFPVQTANSIAIEGCKQGGAGGS